MKVSKIEAALEQLETALRLYFEERSPISVHSLAAAAHEVLTCLHRDGESGEQMLFEQFKEMIRPEYRKQFFDKLRAPQNFFKHANRDREEILEFSPEQTEFILLDCCLGYRRLTNTRTALTDLFVSWARLTFARDAMTLDTDGTAILESVDPELLARYSSMSRKAFFEELFPVVELARSFDGKGREDRRDR